MTWMSGNRTRKWSKGICTVQFMKNTSLHAWIKISPDACVIEIINKEDLDVLLQNNYHDESSYGKENNNAPETPQNRNTRIFGLAVTRQKIFNDKQIECSRLPMLNIRHV